MTQKELLSKYGNTLGTPEERLAFERKWMENWKYPDVIKTNIPALGTSIYINKEFRPVYEKFLYELIRRKLHTEIRTNDECFMPRYIRGHEAQKLISRHSWGIAIDLNKADNPLNMTREQAIAAGLKPFTKEFIQCIRDCSMTAGYDFPRCDGMHLEMR